MSTDMSESDYMTAEQIAVLLCENATLKAENERLREAVDVAFTHAKKMRDAAKLTSPYPRDNDKRRVWVKALYDEGKCLHDKLRPLRAALSNVNTGGEAPKQMPPEGTVEYLSLDQLFDVLTGKPRA